MRSGLRREKHPADAIGVAAMVGRVATGEIEDSATPKDKVHCDPGGKKGGAARAAGLTPKQRLGFAL